MYRSKSSRSSDSPVLRSSLTEAGAGALGTPGFPGGWSADVTGAQDLELAFPAHFPIIAP
jgi:hypothetical protein